MKRITKVMSLGTFVAALVIFSGINAAATPMAAQDARRPLIRAINSVYTKLDPHVTYNGDNLDYAYLACESLYSADLTHPTYAVVPLLAAEFPVWDASFTTMTIALRENVWFQDGYKFNATAVKWNIDRIEAIYDDGQGEWSSSLLNDTTVGTNGLFRIIDVTVVDEYTVEIEINSYFAAIEALLSFMGFCYLSPYSHADVATEAFPATYDKLVGTGPFVYGGKDGGEITWTAFNDYWKGPSDVKEMNWIVNENAVSQNQGLLAGDYDVITLAEDSYFDQFEASDIITFKEGPAGFLQGIAAINCHLYESWQRDAMVHAFNYTHYVEQIKDNTVYRMTSPLPTGIEYGRDDFDYANLDLVYARQVILDNFVGDPRITGLSASDAIDDPDWIAIAESADPFWYINLTYYGPSIGNQDMSLMLEDNFPKIGVFYEGDPVDENRWDEVVNDPALYDTFGMFLVYWSPDYLEAGNQLDPIYMTGAPVNMMQYSNAEVDALLIEAAGTGDRTVRQANYERVQEIIVEEDHPAIMFLRSKQYEIHSIYLSRYYVNSMGYLAYYYAKWDPPAIDIPDIPDEPTVPGYSLGFLLAAIGVVSLLLMKKSKK